MLIRGGITTELLKEQISDFTATTEYFGKLGYEESKAIRLRWRLKLNDKRKEDEERDIEARRNLLKEKSYIFSANANPNYTLIDTCALQFQKGIELIEKSKCIIVVDFILREMEKKLIELRDKNKLDKQENFLLESIIIYKKRFLMSSKYKIIIDEAKKLSTYEDDNILQFLSKFDESNRPTLLTADDILADRAKGYGFEYILIVNHSIKQSTDIDKSKDTVQKEEKTLETVNILETAVSLCDNVIRIKNYKRSIIMYFVKGEKTEKISKDTRKEVKNFDYIVMIKQFKKPKRVKIVKIVIIEGKIKSEAFECRFINEIYKLSMPESILEEAKAKLIH